MKIVISIFFLFYLNFRSLKTNGLLCLKLFLISFINITIIFFFCIRVYLICTFIPKLNLTFTFSITFIRDSELFVIYFMLVQTKK